MFALAVLTLILPQGFTLYSGAAEWWNVALWMAGSIALLLAVGAAGVALMPRSQLMSPAVDAGRAEALSLAIVLIWLGLALMIANFSIIAIDAIGQDF
ncbi:MAG: hypothetical protein ACRDM2_07120 [Gaiellaceae bacterium]